MRFKFLPALILAIVGLPACLTSSPEPERKSFFAVIASDTDVSSDWYETTFGLSPVREVQNENFHINILSNGSNIVEIIEFGAGAPDYVNRSKGFFKAGFLIPDFETSVKGWRDAGLKFSGSGDVVYDEALGLHTVTLLDPDGNRVQIFGHSGSE